MTVPLKNCSCGSSEGAKENVMWATGFTWRESMGIFGERKKVTVSIKQMEEKQGRKERIEQLKLTAPIEYKALWLVRE